MTDISGRLNILATKGIHCMTESADLTTLSPPSPITDATGGIWCLVASPSKGAQVCLNGVVQTTTANVSSLLYKNHACYQLTTAGIWSVWKNNAWVVGADPRESP